MTRSGGLLALLAAIGCSPAGQANAATGQSAERTADTLLVRMVAEISAGVQRASGIEAMGPLHVARADSARVREYLRTELDRQLTVEKQRMLEATYVRLGLIPDSLDLRVLLERLLEEQVVGYYDPRSDTLFVVEKVESEQLETVLVHELVHALQDQRFALDSLAAAVGDDNDRAIAAQSAIEGHATYAMTEWQMSKMTGQPADLTRLPDLDAMLAGMDLSALAGAGGGASVEVLSQAPAVIRTELIFPYIGGMGFVQRLWRSDRTRPLPFGEGLPQSTEQVLHPEAYGADAPTTIRFAEQPASGWTTIYENGMGELETRIYLEELTRDTTLAAAASTGWDGDRFRLLGRSGTDALVWVSVWDSESDAEEFAAAARLATAARYSGPDGESRVVRVERTELAGRPGVRVVDAPAGTDPETLSALGGRLARVTLEGGT